MARRLRVEFAGAIYHVLNRGDRREDIFKDDTDRQRFLETLADACLKTGWQVHAFCLMPNHFHLVVETPQPNLVAGMKWFLGTYTARFNRRHKLDGHLFRGRYKSLLVGGEGGYLRTVCDYVHLNPARAGLVGPDTLLRAFPWSSFPDYLKAPSGRLPWLRVDRVLGESGFQQDTAATRDEFEQRVEALRGRDLDEDFKSIRRGWCFSNDEFRHEIFTQVEAKAGAHHYGEELRESAEAKALRLVEEELRRLEWKPADLLQTRKGDPRKIAIAQRVRAETTVTMTWIAERLHMGTRSHLAHLLYWTGRREREAPKRPKAAAPKTSSPPEPAPAVVQNSVFDTSFD